MQVARRARRQPVARAAADVQGAAMRELAGAVDEVLLGLDRAAGENTSTSIGSPDRGAVPAVPAEAADAVSACLTRIAVAHHGVLPVMRPMARRERAADPIAT
jgi:hypothetical protein